MSTEYAVHFFTTAGVRFGLVTDYLSLTVTRRVNAVGTCQIVLRGDHALLDNANLVRWAIVEVHRRDVDGGQDWRCEFAGRLLADEWIEDDDGVVTWVGQAQDGIGLLALALVAYPAAKASRNTWTSAKAETVLKNLVTYNATSSGTTGDGRVRTVTLAGISVEADGAGGNTIDFSCAHSTLLQALQDVAAVGGGDFDCVRTATGAWQFRWYSGQRGTDKTASVVFSGNYGNMLRPRLRRSRANERTVAIVAGQGQESARTFVVRTSAAYNATTNCGEVFVDARNSSTTNALNAAGDARLAELAARDELSFDILQTPGSRYGRDYDLGDLVTASWLVEQTHKITGVVMSDTVDGETVQIETVAA